MFTITDSITVINVVRDSLRSNLVDPYTTAGGNAGGTARNWIFTDDPQQGTKYPRIQLKKVSNPSTPISMGYGYAEQEQVFINIWFYAKNNFKITVSGVEYKNEQLVEYYMGQIKQTLKGQASTLHTAGAQGYKHINTTEVVYDPETQIHYGAVSIRTQFFTPCS